MNYRLDWHSVLFFLTALFAIEMTNATAESVTQVELIEVFPSGSVNWATGKIEATGVGKDPSNGKAPLNQARAMAERNAYITAARNLDAIVKGVRFDSESSIEDQVKRHSMNSTTVSPEGPLITRKEIDQEGAVRMTVSLHLWGMSSIIQNLQSDIDFQPHTLAEEPPGESGPTGIVVDTRGLGVKPALFPAVLAENGALVYGSRNSHREIVGKTGLVEYRSQSSTSVPSKGPREGSRPLTVKAVGKAGTMGTNVVLGDADVRRIQAEGQLSLAMQHARVVIVIDELTR